MSSTNYTTGQAAAICGVSARTIAKWFDAGKLRGYRVPGGGLREPDRRIPREHLMQFLAKNGMPARGLLEPAVLVVAPDGVVAGTIADALPGWDCHHASTGFDAGRISGAVAVVAAVIDCAIGRGEAVAIAGRLRERHPRILLVALATEDDGSDLTSQGFDSQFQAPVQATAVAARLSAHVATRSKK